MSFMPTTSSRDLPDSRGLSLEVEYCQQCSFISEQRHTKEGDCFTAIEQSVIVGESDNHDRADDDLAVNYHRLILDGVHAKHSCLWQVDDGGSIQRAKDTSVRAANKA